jgi:hypothetical protein
MLFVVCKGKINDFYTMTDDLAKVIKFFWGKKKERLTERKKFGIIIIGRA